MKDVTKQKIYEIRIEKINNKTEKETFFFVYANIDNGVWEFTMENNKWKLW